MTGHHRATVTVLDDSSKMSHKEYLSLLDKLCGSIDDPTFVEPLEIPWEHKAPRIEDIKSELAECKGEKT